MLFAILLAAAVSGVPNYDIAKMCKTANSISSSGDAVGGCVADEKASKDRLIKAWATYPVAARQTCLGNEQLDVGISYVEMETCFQMQDWKMHLDDVGGATVPGAHGPQLQLQQH
jgi:hypothetical protein